MGSLAIDHFGFRLTDKTNLDAAIDEVERAEATSSTEASTRLATRRHT